MKDNKIHYIGLQTPKESNVYSKLMLYLIYDSFGVERWYEYLFFYKHAIPSGLAF